MKLIYRFALLAAFFLLLLFAFGVVLNYQLTHIHQLVVKMNDQPSQIGNRTLTSSRDFYSVNNLMTILLTLDSESLVKDRISSIKGKSADINNNIQNTAKLFSEEEGINLAENSSEVFAEWESGLKQFLAAVANRNLTYAKSLLNGQLKKSSLAVTDSLDKIVNYAKSQNAAFNAETLEDFTRMKIVILSIVSIVVLFFVIFCFLVLAHLIRPMLKAQKLLGSLSNGRLNLTVDEDAEKLAGDLGAKIQSTMAIISEKVAPIKHKCLELEEMGQSFDGDFNAWEVELNRALSAINKQSDDLKHTDTIVKASYHKVGEILNQIQANLMMTSQITSGHVHSLLSLKNPENEALIKKLIEQEESLMAYTEKTSNTIGLLTRFIKDAEDERKEAFEPLAEASPEKLADLKTRLGKLVLQVEQTAKLRNSLLDLLESIKV